MTKRLRGEAAYTHIAKSTDENAPSCVYSREYVVHAFLRVVGIGPAELTVIDDDIDQQRHRIDCTGDVDTFASEHVNLGDIIYATICVETQLLDGRLTSTKTITEITEVRTTRTVTSWLRCT